jgi:hypothetical protein
MATLIKTVILIQNELGEGESRTRVLLHFTLYLYMYAKGRPFTVLVRVLVVASSRLGVCVASKHARTSKRYHNTRTHAKAFPGFFSSSLLQFFQLAPNRSHRFFSWGCHRSYADEPYRATISILTARLPCQVRLSTWRGDCSHTCLCTVYYAGISLGRVTLVAAEPRIVSSAKTDECSSPARKLFTGIKFHVFQPQDLVCPLRRDPSPWCAGARTRAHRLPPSPSPFPPAREALGELLQLEPQRQPGTKARLVLPRLESRGAGAGRRRGDGARPELL